MFFTIKLAEKCDAKDVFSLSNDSEVRKNSFNTNVITWEDHIKWFKNKIVSEGCVFFVIRSDENKFIGQIRFDSITEEKKTYIVSISVHKDFRGKGLGSKLLKESIDRLFDNFDAKKIYAYIQEINKPSLKTFNKIGYKIVGDKICNDVKFLKLQYCKK